MAESCAQAPLSCQFCDTSTDVKWICHDCCLNLCDGCKVQLHSRVSFATEHMITDFKAVKLSEIQKEMFRSICCDHHQHQFCCLFCNSCNELICPSCLLQSHKDHKFDEIPIAFERKRRDLENTKEKINRELNDSVHGERTETEKLLSKEGHRYEETKQNIMVHAENITQCIEESKSKLLNQLEVFNNRKNEFVKSENKMLDEKEQILQEKYGRIKKALRSGSPADVFSACKMNIEEQESIESTMAFVNSVVEFVGGKISKHVVQRMFGWLAEIRVFKSYDIDHADVGIIHASESHLWVANKENKVFRKIKAGIGLQTVVQIEEIEISDFAVTPTGEAILKISKSNKLKLLSNTGKQRLFRDFSPLKPTCVHVSTTGDILVGTKDTGPNFIVSEKSRRKLVVLTSGGKEKSAFEYNNNVRLFTYIWKVTSTHIDEMCTIDRLSENYKGRIIMLERNGSIKWIFCGNSDEGDTFKPRDLVATCNGYIVVSERLKHAINILSVVEGFLVRVITSEINIYLPNSLCLDNRGNLWIGSDTCIEEKAKAKLHMTRLCLL